MVHLAHFAAALAHENLVQLKRLLRDIIPFKPILCFCFILWIISLQNWTQDVKHVEMSDKKAQVQWSD